MGKRFLVFVLLIGILVLSFGSISAKDAAELKMPVYVNPIYQEYYKGEEPSSGQLRKSSPSARSAEDVPFVETQDELVTLMRAELAAHHSGFSISFRHEEFSQSEFDAFFADIREMAMMHTGEPNEGDYIRYNCWKMTPEVTGTCADDELTCSYTMTFDVIYMHNEEQEADASAAFNQAYQDIYDSIQTGGASEAEIVSAVYEYVIEHVSYDEEHLDDDEYLLKHSSYAAIVNHTAVCQGYASMMYRLLLMFDIDNRVVSSDTHAWNIVNVGGNFYQLDATWGDDGGLNQQDVRDEYFLRALGAWNDGDHVFSAEYQSDEFNALYPISDLDYVPPSFEIEDGVLVAYHGNDSVIVIPDGVTKIDDQVFYENTTLTSVTMPEGLTWIGQRAFMYCTNLKTVNFPSTLTSILHDAFGFCSSLTSIELPDSVTGLGAGVFEQCTSLQSVKLSENLTTINSGDFYHCESLETIDFPAKVKYINTSAFQGCASLTNVTLPEKLQTVGSKAFTDCPNLTSVAIPEINYSTTSSDAFDYSTVVFSVEHLAVYDGETYISRPLYWLIQLNENGQGAKFRLIGEEGDWTNISGEVFAYFGDETAVEIPEDATTIYPGTFIGTNVTEVTIPASVNNIYPNAIPVNTVIHGYEDSYAQQFAEDQGYVFEPIIIDVQWDVDEATGIMTIDGTGVYEASFYTELPWNEYMWNETVQAIQFGEEITRIGPYYFEAFNGLTDVSIPEGIISIGDFAFFSCWQINNVVLPSTLTKIGDYAFANCSSLDHIFIPATVEEIGENVFDGSDAVIWVNSEEDPAAEWARTHDRPYQVIEINGDFVIAGSVLIAYNGSDENIMIPDNVTAIGEGVFRNNTSLQSVVLPQNLTTIGSGAFAGCTNLTGISLPDSLSEISSDAFDYDRVVFTVTPSTVMDDGGISYNYVQSWVRWESNNYQGARFRFPDQTSDWTIEANTLYAYLGSETDVTIPDNVDGISKGAFVGSTVTDVTILNGVSWIDDELVLPAGTVVHGFESSTAQRWAETHGYSFKFLLIWRVDENTGIMLITGTGTFDAKRYSDLPWKQYVYTNIVTTINFGVNVTAIGPYYFYGFSGLDVQYIPEGIESIGSKAFASCQNLEIIGIPRSVTTIADDAFDSGILYVYEDSYAYNWAVSHNRAFHVINGPDLTQVDTVLYSYIGGDSDYSIPSDVNTIADYAFYRNQYINSLVIPEGVTSIGTKAFYQAKLQSVSIPGTVKNIGKEAFWNNYPLTQVTIEDGVETIGAAAFQYCSNLESVAIPRSVISIGERAFEGIRMDVYKDSYAHTWALEHEQSFSLIDDPDPFTVVGDTLYSYTGTDQAEIDLRELGITKIANGAFANHEEITKVVFPNDLTEIGDNAFKNCFRLASADLPDTVTAIGTYAFWNCAFTSLTVPGSVETIGDYAFAGSDTLASVVLEEGVKKIGNHAFTFDNALAEIMIPDSVENIGFEAIPMTTVITANAGSYAANWGQTNGYIVKLIVTVTFQVVNGSWNDGTDIDQTVKLIGLVGSDDLKLTSEQIPAVGSKPNTGYKDGAWDVVPDTETAINENLTYIYTYAEASAAIPGDLNGDGKVNGADLIRLKQFLVSMSVEFKGNPDVTGDGKVNGADLIRLKQYLVNMPVVLY